MPHRFATIRLSLFLACLFVATAGIAANTADTVERPPQKAAERQDEPQEAHDFFVQKRAPIGETAIPAERYFKALARMRVMPQHTLQGNAFLPSRAELAERGISYVTEAQTLGAWSSLGPGNIGGRTRALVVDPRDPQILFAGGVAGGVWKTTNGGGSWRPLDDLMANLAIGSLAMDPADSNTLYAGTGEGYFNSDSVRGAGIFKTTDGGLNWSRLAATANSPDFYYVNDLAISPRDPQRVYAATRTGVWRSLDAGATWTRTLDPKVTGGCLDLALRTDTGADALFASCGTREGTAAVWRDQAAERSGGWSKVLGRKGMGRTTLAIAPSNQNVIYALASSNVPGPGGKFQYGLLAVYRSQNGGKTWSVRLRNTNKKKLNTLLLTNPVYGYAGQCFENFADTYYNQGWYDNAIAVDPVNPNRVWAGGIDLFRSDDGGRNWALTSYWWAREGASNYVHADQHAIVFHPDYDGAANKTMFVANDGGVFQTRNALAPGFTTLSKICDRTGAGAFGWTDLNHGYGVTQFYSGAVYPDGATYFGGTQDNGTVRSTSAAGSGDWREILGGDGGYVAVNPDDTRIVYGSFTNLSLMKSTDGGNQFKESISGIDDPNFLFIAPFVMDPSDPDRLWIGGSHLWRTDNAAASWTQASVKLTDRFISALAVAPSNPNRVLAGTTLGVIHSGSQALTANAGTGWAGARPREGFVSSVAFDPRDANVAYATYSTFGGTHVWKSTDGGATWSGLDGNGSGRLPDLPAHSIVVDPDDGRRLYLGTDLGVFVSTDGGANWAVENTGFANVVTESLVPLKGPGGSRTLFAFTHGRGAWRVSIGN